MNAHLNKRRDLVELTRIVNRTAYRVCGYRNTCILASNALNYLLMLMGYKSRIVRIEAGAFPKSRDHYCCVLGSAGDGTRRPAAQPGQWNGHVGVLVDEEWLCDPTFDQANQKGIKVEPVVVKLESTDPHRNTRFKLNNCDCRYNLFHTQKGFRHSPDSRPSHWMVIVDLAILALDRQRTRRLQSPVPAP